MRFIISPAKKMRAETDYYVPLDRPPFPEQTKTLLEWIRSLSYEQQKALWACSDKIAGENSERFARMDLTRDLVPAIMAYDGIQCTSMGPSVMERGQLDYVQQHVRILSGFYGVLRPMDGVRPYRLEMQARAEVGGFRDLYDFWGDSLYLEILDESRVIVNLASKEYSRCIEKYLCPEDRYITCVFGEVEKGKVVQKGVYAKMARGDMIRYASAIRAERPEQLKAYDRCYYHFDPERSTETEYVFVRRQIPGKGAKNFPQEWE